MAVSNLIVQQIFLGNGATTAFAIPFDFILNAEIRVVLRDETGSPIVETLQVLGVDYTLSGGPPVTTVDMTTAPTSTQKLLLIRRSVKNQTIDFLETSSFPSETNEEGLDHAIRLHQEACQKLERTALLAESTPTSGITIPEPEGDKILGWNTAGDNLKNFTASEISSAAALPDLIQNSASLSNNVSVAANVTGFSLDKLVAESAAYIVEIQRDTDTNSSQTNGWIILQFTGTSPVWRVQTSLFSGDILTGQSASPAPAGIEFSVTEAAGVAQLQYTSSDVTGANHVTTIKFKRIAFTV